MRAGNRTFAMADTATIIGSRPSDCPHSYCGCGLRKYLGISDVRLNLASNEAAPRPGLAAVRSGHVMYIEAAAGNGQWLIRDYNSGGGLSRMHVRDVRGYVFVNPHGKSIGQLNCEEEILLPDVAGGFNDERQLRSLVVFGQRVPGHRAGEAALGADRQTVEFDVARGFLRTSL